MNGCVIPHTPIAVDFWKVRQCPQSRIFFLTHLHGDHITGLTSSWNFPLYCSEITGKLLETKHGLKKELIHALQIGEAEIVYLDEDRREQMTVTALEANHCLGAVMFLMQGYFGTILHTGDFRYSPEMIDNGTLLSNMAGEIDQLYLDNTYCSPGCIFPTRQEATSEIIQIIEAHPDHDVLIAMRNLGKESLLCEVALHFHEWIYIPEKFRSTLELLNAPDVFDTTSLEHRIRVVPFHKVSRKFIEALNEDRRTIVIMPTSLYVGIDARPYENVDSVFIVPYSDHSSFTELKTFVSFLKPKKIIPIVKASSRGPFGLDISDRADMSIFSKYTEGNWNRIIDIPASVEAFMRNTSLRLAIDQKGRKRKAKPPVPQPRNKMAKRGITYDGTPDKSIKVTRQANVENRTKQGAEAVKRDLFVEEQTETVDMETREVVGTTLIDLTEPKERTIPSVNEKIQSNDINGKSFEGASETIPNETNQVTQNDIDPDTNDCNANALFGFEFPESQGFNVFQEFGNMISESLGFQGSDEEEQDAADAPRTADSKGNKDTVQSKATKGEDSGAGRATYDPDTVRNKIFIQNLLGDEESEMTEEEINKTKNMEKAHCSKDSQNLLSDKKNEVTKEINCETNNAHCSKTGESGDEVFKPTYFRTGRKRTSSHSKATEVSSKLDLEAIESLTASQKAIEVEKWVYQAEHETKKKKHRGENNPEKSVAIYKWLDHSQGPGSVEEQENASENSLDIHTKVIKQTSTAQSTNELKEAISEEVFYEAEAELIPQEEVLDDIEPESDSEEEIDETEAEMIAQEEVLDETDPSQSLLLATDTVTTSTPIKDDSSKTRKHLRRHDAQKSTNRTGNSIPTTLSQYFEKIIPTEKSEVSSSQAVDKSSDSPNWHNHSPVLGSSKSRAKRTPVTPRPSADVIQSLTETAQSTPCGMACQSQDTYYTAKDDSSEPGETSKHRTNVFEKMMRSSPMPEDNSVSSEPGHTGKHRTNVFEKMMGSSPCLEDPANVVEVTVSSNNDNVKNTEDTFDEAIIINTASPLDQDSVALSYSESEGTENSDGYEDDSEAEADEDFNKNSVNHTQDSFDERLVKLKTAFDRVTSNTTRKAGRNEEDVNANSITPVAKAKDAAPSVTGDTRETDSMVYNDMCVKDEHDTGSILSPIKGKSSVSVHIEGNDDTNSKDGAKYRKKDSIKVISSSTVKDTKSVEVTEVQDSDTRNVEVSKNGSIILNPRSHTNDTRGNVSISIEEYTVNVESSPKYIVVDTITPRSRQVKSCTGVNIKVADSSFVNNDAEVEHNYANSGKVKSQSTGMETYCRATSKAAGSCKTQADFVEAKSRTTVNETAMTKAFTDALSLTRIESVSENSEANPVEAKSGNSTMIIKMASSDNVSEIPENAISKSTKTADFSAADSSQGNVDFTNVISCTRRTMKLVEACIANRSESADVNSTTQVNSKRTPKAISAYFKDAQSSIANRSESADVNSTSKVTGNSKSTLKATVTSDVTDTYLSKDNHSETNVDAESEPGVLIDSNINANTLEERKKSRNVTTDSRPSGRCSSDSKPSRNTNTNAKSSRNGSTSSETSRNIITNSKTSRNGDSNSKASRDDRRNNRSVSAKGSKQDDAGEIDSATGVQEQRNQDSESVCNANGGSRRVNRDDGSMSRDASEIVVSDSDSDTTDDVDAGEGTDDGPCLYCQVQAFRRVYRRTQTEQGDDEDSDNQQIFIPKHLVVKSTMSYNRHRY